MFRNYLKIAIRNLSRHKMFSFINIFGLALSMSVCLIVLIRIKDQLGYDRFHPWPERTYRITTALTDKDGRTYELASTPLPLATTLTANYNLVEKYTRLYPYNGKANAGNKEFQLQTAFTDSAFFEVFGFNLAAGNQHTALAAPNSIVLNKETAAKFFGNTNPVGQVISLPALGDFRVTGVLDQPAGKSHLAKEAYLSMSSVQALERTGKISPVLAEWDKGSIGYTYLLLKENIRAKQLATAVAQISKDLVKQSQLNGKESFTFEVQPFNTIILGKERIHELGHTGSRGKVLAEITIAFIILLSACFNYTNLSIARSLNRGKEVGIRKVAGAVRYQVFTQFIMESVLLSVLALGLAYVLLKLMMDYAPFSAEFFPADAPLDAGLLGWFLLFSIFTGLLAGVLPAWALSSFKPVEVLKNLATVKLFAGNSFRKTLIVVQFSLSLVIIIFTMVFSKQFRFMAAADPGFERSHIFTLPLPDAQYEVLAHNIEQLNGVQEVTASSDKPGKNAFGRTAVVTTKGNNPVSIDHVYTDAHFISTMGLQLLAGTSFPETTHGQEEKYIIINERAVSALQLRSPAEAIGKMAWLDDSVEMRIAGVIKDFYYRGVDLPYMPLLLRNQPGSFRYLLVKTAGTPPAAFVNSLESVWKKQYPGQPFEGKWLLAEMNERMGAWGTLSMLGFLALMAITLACLGLLGMVIYTTQTRRREIGIRKVMGASVGAIIALLSKGFLKLVLIAGCIALPISYLLSYLFLNLFANRISVGAGILFSSFSVMLLLVLITIGTHIYRVAASNPVNSLRTD